MILTSGLKKNFYKKNKLNKLFKYYKIKNKFL